MLLKQEYALHWCSFHSTGLKYSTAYVALPLLWIKFHSYFKMSGFYSLRILPNPFKREKALLRANMDKIAHKCL